MSQNYSNYQEIALRESDRMRIMAAEYRQMGLTALARFLDQNATKALRSASGERSEKEKSHA